MKNTKTIQDIFDDMDILLQDFNFDCDEVIEKTKNYE